MTASKLKRQIAKSGLQASDANKLRKGLKNADTDQDLEAMEDRLKRLKRRYT